MREIHYSSSSSSEPSSEPASASTSASDPRPRPRPKPTSTTTLPPPSPPPLPPATTTISYPPLESNPPFLPEVFTTLESHISRLQEEVKGFRRENTLLRARIRETRRVEWEEYYKKFITLRKVREECWLQEVMRDVILRAEHALQTQKWEDEEEDEEEDEGEEEGDNRITRECQRQREEEEEERHRQWANIARMEWRLANDVLFRVRYEALRAEEAMGMGIEMGTGARHRRRRNSCYG